MVVRLLALDGVIESGHLQGIPPVDEERGFGAGGPQNRLPDGARNSSDSFASPFAGDGTFSAAPEGMGIMSLGVLLPAVLLAQLLSLVAIALL